MQARALVGICKGYSQWKLEAAEDIHIAERARDQLWWAADKTYQEERQAAERVARLRRIEVINWVEFMRLRLIALPL